MPDEIVVDASVMASIVFEDANSPQARAVLDEGISLVAPSLLLIEVASIAAKAVRPGGVSQALAARAVLEARLLIDEFIPDEALAEDALRLALKHGFTAYDAVYLALASAREAPVFTADQRLWRRAESEGLANLIRLLRVT